ncbi:hypothetical protein SAMN05192553_10957 [Cyclobacterium xiamenense]|uniref:Regulation of enolase protein 1, concanavalin A-like superfamily n=1 Tax=Cyclobacterium xiamenense TaxID=1297121 RepID=A0A1H7AZV8_9BACT|nr:DUF1349 domain-containing protein [Cyclobacterium xiamenense]SEJ71103.1 hypothetical protein SAMN05192553_10957 [Cyclobacterium xiamenense]
MAENYWEGFRWMNEPGSWSFEQNSLRLLTDGETDFWRVTEHDFIQDNGHFFFREVPGTFDVLLRFSGTYRDLYDQAGLMLRVNETNWIKAGIEWVDGLPKASVVVTRDFSDWSIRDLPETPANFWIRARRGRDHVELSYSTDALRFEMLRVAYFPPATFLQVGPMAASPKGRGFEVSFDPPSFPGW